MVLYTYSCHQNQQKCVATLQYGVGYQTVIVLMINISSYVKKVRKNEIKTTDANVHLYKTKVCFPIKLAK